MKLKGLCLVFVSLALALSMGCDAFVRKFTRKPKKTGQRAEELVLMPEEYKPPQMTKEEAYRQRFLYWKSWHDELINALLTGASQKKQADCISEALKNLGDMRSALGEGSKIKLDIYIGQSENLRANIERDLYGNDLSQNRMTAERLKRGILRDFSYEKIKDDLI
ncbi:MAG: hypothetical protein PHE18_08730 [Candidatus Omnitrophica bacterium]|nr:hypothetical protein [Candidatus Omnitrophota bacterium]MDD5553936.1 hypothetical protein [Candidatus Omnitrophota bacterium]